MFDEMRELYQEVIMDHNRNPRNFRTLDGADRVVEGHNPLCGDSLTLMVDLEDGHVHDIAWQGMGCAISKSSTSLMTEAVKGRTIEEAQALYENFHRLVTRDGEADKDLLGKLKVFSGVGEFPARVKCATLAWRTLAAALEGGETTVSTEAGEA
jgi:nitrogen fixation protein NifU and related proteins